MAFDIGPIGNLEGRVVGLNAATSLTGDIAPVLLERAYLHRRAAKLHNDKPGAHTIGSEEGRRVTWEPKL